MSNNKSGKKRQAGYRHQNVPHTNRIRVRSKRLDQVDPTKIALAFWMLAQQMVEDESDAAKPIESPGESNEQDTDADAEEAA